MNNKPVAWMNPNESSIDYKFSDECAGDWNIPLYTHPVNPKYDPETGEPLIDGYPLFSGLPHPVKELTIEEIDEVSKEIFKGYKNFYHYQINFARAILRKAQEK